MESKTATDRKFSASFPYKVGWRGLALGTIGLLAALAFSETMLSSDASWHLFAADDGLIIPNAAIQLIWWGIFLGAGAVFVLSLVPGMTISLTDQEIRVPNLFTRKYKVLEWAKILDVTATRRYITLSGQDERLDIQRLGLSKGAWDELWAQIQLRTGERAQ